MSVLYRVVLRPSLRSSGGAANGPDNNGADGVDAKVSSAVAPAAATGSSAAPPRGGVAPGSIVGADVAAAAAGAGGGGRPSVGGSAAAASRSYAIVPAPRPLPGLAQLLASPAPSPSPPPPLPRAVSSEPEGFPGGSPPLSPAATPVPIQLDASGGSSASAQQQLLAAALAVSSVGAAASGAGAGVSIASAGGAGGLDSRRALVGDASGAASSASISESGLLRFTHQPPKPQPQASGSSGSSSGSAILPPPALRPVASPPHGGHAAGKTPEPPAAAARVNSKTAMEKTDIGSAASSLPAAAAAASSQPQAQQKPHAPCVEQIVYAELHLFRRFLKTKAGGSSSAAAAAAGASSSSSAANDSKLALKRVRCVCIVAVPHWASLKSIAELGGIALSDVESARRVVDDTGTRKQSLLLEFRDTDKCTQFVDKCNGNLFDARRPEVCYAVYLSKPPAVVPVGVAAAAATTPAPATTATSASSAPTASAAPLASASPAGMAAPAPVVVSAVPPAAAATPTTAAPADKTLLPGYGVVPHSHAELPTCPLCFERLDVSVSGVVPRTTLRRTLSGGSVRSTPQQSAAWSDVVCRICQMLKLASDAAYASSNTTDPYNTTGGGGGEGSSGLYAAYADLFTCHAGVIGFEPAAATAAAAASAAASASSGGSVVGPLAPAAGTAAPARPTHAPIATAAASSPAAAGPTCAVRGDDREALWLCMLCAHVGCGRYHQSHAVAHFEKTSHRYAIELKNQCIWDYEADGYKHRLWNPRAGSSYLYADDYANDEGERLRVTPSHAAGAVGVRPEADTGTGMGLGVSRSAVMGSGPNAMGMHDDNPYAANARYQQQYGRAGGGGRGGGGGGGAVYAAGVVPPESADEQEMIRMKLESISVYYNHLLTNQLQEQYNYFELKMQSVDRELRIARTQQSAQLNSMDAQNAQLTSAIEEAEREHKAADRNASKLHAQVARVESDNAFLRDLNKSLLNDQKPAATAAGGGDGAAAADAEVARLQRLSDEKDKRIAQLRHELDGAVKELERQSAAFDKHVTPHTATADAPAAAGGAAPAAAAGAGASAAAPAAAAAAVAAGAAKSPPPHVAVAAQTRKERRAAAAKGGSGGGGADAGAGGSASPL